MVGVKNMGGLSVYFFFVGINGHLKSFAPGLLCILRINGCVAIVVGLGVFMGCNHAFVIRLLFALALRP